MVGGVAGLPSKLVNKLPEHAASILCAAVISPSPPALAPNTSSSSSVLLRTVSIDCSRCSCSVAFEVRWGVTEESEPVVPPIPREEAGRWGIVDWVLKYLIMSVSRNRNECCRVYS